MISATATPPAATPAATRAAQPFDLDGHGVADLAVGVPSRASAGEETLASCRC
jgi:hypothetical protein